MLSSYLLNSWIKSTCSAESRVILKTVKCSVRWQHKLFHNGHFSPGTNLLGALWVLLLRQWLPLLGVTCWFLIRPQHLPVERPHIYIFILSSLLNLRHLLGIIFWMSNGPLKPKIVKLLFLPKLLATSATVAKTPVVVFCSSSSLTLHTIHQKTVVATASKYI